MVTVLAIVLQVDNWLILFSAGLSCMQFKARIRFELLLIYGPFRVDKVISVNAYRLQLPPSSHSHPVFNVSALKTSQERTLYLKRNFSKVCK